MGTPSQVPSEEMSKKLRTREIGPTSWTAAESCFDDQGRAGVPLPACAPACQVPRGHRRMSGRSRGREVSDLWGSEQEAPWLPLRGGAHALGWAPGAHLQECPSCPSQSSNSLSQAASPVGALDCWRSCPASRVLCDSAWQAHDLVLLCSTCRDPSRCSSQSALNLEPISLVPMHVLDESHVLSPKAPSRAQTGALTVDYEESVPSPPSPPPLPRKPS